MTSEAEKNVSREEMKWMLRAMKRQDMIKELLLGVQTAMEGLSILLKKMEGAGIDKEYGKELMQIIRGIGGKILLVSKMQKEDEVC